MGGPGKQGAGMTSSGNRAIAIGASKLDDILPKPEHRMINPNV